MIIKPIDNNTYSQLKDWLKRKGYTNSAKMTDSTFVYLAGIVVNKALTRHNAKEQLYSWISKNSRLEESARANRIRNSNVKKNKTIPKRNGYNGGYAIKRIGRATERGEEI